MSGNQTQAHLIDKMCRKIAQLTRVVYILNTKNDDNESITEAIITGYDEVMQKHARESNEAVKKMKSRLDKVQQATSVSDKVNAINEKYEQSVNGFNVEYDRLKKEVQKKQKSINDEYQEKYNKMLKEIVDIKKLADAKVNDLLKRNEEEKRKLQLEKDKNKYANAAEIENIKKSYENQIASIKSEHTKLIEKINSEHKSEIMKVANRDKGESNVDERQRQLQQKRIKRRRNELLMKCVIAL